MGTRIAATTVALLVLAVRLFSSTANATDITYNVSQLIGPAGSVTGYIQTNGATGTLNGSDIISWHLFLNDGTKSFTLLSGSGCGTLGDGFSCPTNSSQLFFNTNDLSASTTQLMFNFNDSSAGSPLSGSPNEIIFGWHSFLVPPFSFTQAALCLQAASGGGCTPGSVSGEGMFLSGPEFGAGYNTTNFSNLTGPAVVIASVGPNMAVATSASGPNTKYSYAFAGLSGTGDVFIPIISPTSLLSLPPGAMLITDTGTILADWPGAGNNVPGDKLLFANPGALLEIPEDGANTLSFSFLDTNPPLTGPILVDGQLVDPSVPGNGGGTTSVPEPASLTLLGTALLGLGAIRRRRKRAQK